MLKRIVIIGLPLFISSSFAQAPDTLWTRTYGDVSPDWGYSVHQTFDGGYIVAGSKYDTISKFDVYLIKTDANGDSLWIRTYGGDEDDEGYSVDQTTGGGYIVAGYSRSIGSPPRDGIYIIKTDSVGDTVWTHCVPGPEPGAVGRSVQQTSDGGYIIAGSIDFFQNRDIGLVKLNSSGLLELSCPYGGQYTDAGYSVDQTTDGGYVIVGITYSFGVGIPDCSNIYLIKTDSMGDTLWTKAHGGDENDYGYSVKQTADGGYIIAGSTTIGGNGFGLLLKTDSLGDTLWTRIFPQGEVSSVQATSDGGYILVGSHSGDVLLIKTDTNGDTLWTAAYGTTDGDRGYSVEETTDDGYIIAGYTRFPPGTQSNVYLVKTRPDTFGILENKVVDIKNNSIWTTLFSGPLLLPEGEKYRVFDITGRVVKPQYIKPGIYFIEVDGDITQKVIKIR